MTKSLLSAGLLLVALAGQGMAEQGKPGSHFIENWDMDGDGQVTPVEAEAKRGELFYMFDQNEDGLLNDAEYTMFDETRQSDMDTNAGGHKKGPMKIINQGLQREFNDVDGDGQVSRDEFLTRTGAWFEQIDRTGDAAITTDDFKPRSN